MAAEHPAAQDREFDTEAPTSALLDRLHDFIVAGSDDTDEALAYIEELRSRHA